jgi:parallel beta-helix repeat protein
MKGSDSPYVPESVRVGLYDVDGACQPAKVRRPGTMESRVQKTWNLLVASAVLSVVSAAPAMAQATRTWVSGVGDDANPCSRTAPCKTFAGAISRTATGGEINVLDPGGFGGVTITKAITLRSDSIEAGVLVSGTSGIVINAPATAKVVIDGLDFEGTSTASSINGINILSARDVLVRNSNIRGFDSVSSAGILVNGSTQISLTVENCTLFNNTIGIVVSSSSGTGAARVFNSTIAGSAVAGIRVTGAGNKAEISGNQIIRTPKSLDILSGAIVNSYGDNVLTAGDAPTIVPKG